MWNRAAALAAILTLCACRAQSSEPHFPSAHRDVAPIVGESFSTEDARDRVGEAEEVMEQLRTAISLLGGRKPNRLAAVKQEKRVEELRLLGERLRHGSLIPGLTVHQAKGCEWTSVGVVLTPNDAAVLSNGLQPLTDDHCILYVALTRAKEHCGRLIAEEAESAALD